MRDFSFYSQDKDDAQEVEKILRERKRKIAKQQLVYTIILLAILTVIALWFYRKTVYAEFDGYVTTDVNVLRPDEDIYFLESNFIVGDLVVPGDTLFSFVIAHNFYVHEHYIHEEPQILSRNRDMTVQYGLARQDLEVLRVRISELERQLATEDHNIRFGLSDNHNKLRTEQALAEAREQYNALRRKIGVLWNALAQTNKAVSRLNNNGYGHLDLTDMRKVALLDSLGLVRYSIAVDSAIVTKKHVASFSLVLRGEPVLSSQSLDLRDNNLSIMAYVMPKEMEYVNYHSEASIIVNDEISYKANVLMLGARTEEIPGELRNTLSRDHTASIVVFEIDSAQNIPFWSLANGVPVRVRINKFRNRTPRIDDYIIYNTSDGVDTRTLSDRRKRYEKRIGKASPIVMDMRDTVPPQTAEPQKKVTPQSTQSTAPAAKEKQTAEPYISSGTTGTYHIIVGSGQDEEGAKRQAAALKRKGYAGARVFSTGGKHRISIGSFTNSRDANQAVAVLKKHAAYSSAWVIHEQH